MGSARVVGDSRSGDARLTLAVTAASVAAFGVFVVVPPSVAEFDPPPGIDAVWSVGGLLTIFLGPVVAGLCGYVSAAALWRHRGALSAPVRRLHLVTLLLVAVAWLGLFSPWGSTMVSWWLE
jgi:H+/Cl- antiporter ClcA